MGAALAQSPQYFSTLCNNVNINLYTCSLGINSAFLCINLYRITEKYMKGILWPHNLIIKATPTTCIGGHYNV